MGRVCAVATCKTWIGGRKKQDSSTSFFSFPRDKSLRSIWVSKCKRADAFDVSNSFVCSKHFLVEDYDPGFLLRQKLMPHQKHQRTLKPGATAIPSANLPSSSSALWYALRLQHTHTLQMFTYLLHERK